MRRRNGEQPFAGVLIDIRRRGVDTGFLLRGQVTRIGVEVWFKLYSPNIEGIDVVQRSVKRARRAKLYYMRYVLSPLREDEEEEGGDADRETGSRNTIWGVSRILSISTRGRVRCCVEMGTRAVRVVRGLPLPQRERRERSRRCCADRLYITGLQKNRSFEKKT